MAICPLHPNTVGAFCHMCMPKLREIVERAAERQARICLMCHARGQRDVVSTLVSHDATGLEWLECANHGPKDNLVQTERIGSLPLAEWLRAAPPPTDHCTDELWGDDPDPAHQQWLKGIGAKSSATKCPACGDQSIVQRQRAPDVFVWVALGWTDPSDGLEVEVDNCPFCGAELLDSDENGQLPSKVKGTMPKPSDHIRPEGLKKSRLHERRLARIVLVGRLILIEYEHDSQNWRTKGNQCPKRR
jgi:hypothetical protein